MNEKINEHGYAIYVIAFLFIIFHLQFFLPYVFNEMHFYSKGDVSLSFKYSIEIVKLLGQLITLFVALAGIVIAYRRTIAFEKSVAISQDNLLLAQNSLTATQEKDRLARSDERFSKAVDMVASSSEAIRVGGLYSLEKLTQEDPETYYTTVIDIVTLFIRNRMSEMQDSITDYVNSFSEDEIPKQRRLPVDVHAALNVISRRDWIEKINPSFENIHQDTIDLSHLDFSCFILDSIIFNNTNISNSHFKFCSMNNTVLNNISANNSVFSNINSYKIVITNSEIIDTQMNSSKFIFATIQNSDFYTTDFTSCNFDETEIKKCEFGGSYFNFSSFLDTEIENCSFHHSELNGVKFISTKLINTTIDISSNLKKATFDNASIINNTWQYLKLDNALIQDSTFTNGTLIFCNFHSSIVTRSKFDNTSIKSSGFENAKLFSDFSNTDLGVDKVKTAWIDNNRTQLPKDIEHEKQSLLNLQIERLDRNPEEKAVFTSILKQLDEYDELPPF